LAIFAAIRRASSRVIVRRGAAACAAPVQNSGRNNVSDKLFLDHGAGRQCVESLMKLLRTTALTAALMTAAVPSLTTPANAWGWRGGWGWGGVGLGLAAGALIGSAVAASSYGYYGYGYPYYGYGYGYPAYGYGYGYAPAYAAYGYGYPAYGYGTGYYGGYRYAYHPIIRRHIYAYHPIIRRRWRY
jgi:hypothetical protein